MDLLDALPRDRTPTPLGDGALLLPDHATPHSAALLSAIAHIAATAPFRHLTTPGGATMSVAMTNTGPLGWTSDRRGYRYTPHDPATGHPWPPMPPLLQTLAATAAAQAGYPGFTPDACLLNRYLPGTRLSLHQDRDEPDLSAPIVSVSLGLPATFLFGGPTRTDPIRRIRLQHGDVVVWGGASRLAFHGIAPLKPGAHAATGPLRYNLTFRRVCPEHDALSFPPV